MHSSLIRHTLNMASGKYNVALWLPDAFANLQSRPEYSVRFANMEVWYAVKGYNILTDSLIIK